MFQFALRAATAGLALVAGITVANATDYPLTVTDLAGKTVTIQSEPQRIALQDGRDISILALLDRDDPFKRVVVWNNILKSDDAAAWNVFSRTWPADAAKPFDMGFGDNGDVNPEQLIANKPQVVIIQRRAYDSFVQAGLDKKLAELGIPLLAIDTFTAPVPNAAASVELLGKVLNREKEASDYVSFYNAHLNKLKATVAASGKKPSVFVEALAGRQGPEQCCFTHGKAGWGALVEAAGLRNIGSDLIKGASGDVTLETVIGQKPDVYVFTGRQSSKAGNAMVPLGYKADKAKIDAAMTTLEARPGFASVAAAKNDQVYAMWHLFYSHPYNIVAIEWLAKFALPKEFADLDPDKTYKSILSDFTRLPSEQFIYAEQAPALVK
ncbi:MAG TPA: ABC transporter substrate-binding protein [Ensifer sp.]|nr:ABC transporter substrate-binding protein [Ensifer sp.]